MPNQQNEIDKIDQEFGVKLTATSVLLIKELSKKNIKSASQVESAVNSAFKGANTIDALQSSISESATQYINVGRGGDAFSYSKIKNRDKVLETVIKSTYGKQKRPLFKTLRSGELQSVVESEIKNTMLNVANWKKTISAIRPSIDAELPQYINQIIRLGKKSLNDPEAFRQYISSIKRARANIENLVENQASGPGLRKNYEAIIKASQDQSEKALNLAIRRSVNKKMRYHAERIAISESSFNYGQALQQNAIDDEIIGAIRFKLDPAHPETDECDGWAKADMFGLGQGIYPKNRFPVLPIHPNGKSLGIDVSFDALGEKKPSYNPNGVENYLKSNPRNQKAILGVQGAKEFKKDPSSWSKYAKNLAKPPKFKPYLPE